MSIFNFFSSEFPSSEFSLSEWEEISILPIIYLEIFFSLTTDLNSPKNTWVYSSLTCSKNRIDQNYWLANTSFGILLWWKLLLIFPL